MSMRKNFLNRIARRKGAAQAESEEGYEIPPPAAIEQDLSYATGNSEDKGLGSHQELELIVSGEPVPTGSANPVDAVDGGDAPVLEALVEPVTDESPDAPGPPREAAPYEGYGLDLELLSESESEASPEEPGSSPDASPLEDEAADSVVEASVPEPEVIQGNEPDAMDEMVQEVEESLAASITDNAPDEAVLSQDTKPDEVYGDDFEALAAPVSDASADAPEPIHEEDESIWPVSESVADAARPEPEVIQESEPEAVDNAVAEDEETRTAPVLRDSPDEDKPPLVNEEADSEIAESATEVAAPEPEIARESEPAEDITEEVGECLAAAVTQDSPDESLEPALAENGIFPLVRDARGVWRPGKGFSRGELREAGLSLVDASRLHIRFDKRRQNTHAVNVASLEQAKSGVWWREPAVKGSNDERIRLGNKKLLRIRRIRRRK